MVLTITETSNGDKIFDWRGKRMISGNDIVKRCKNQLGKNLLKLPPTFLREVLNLDKKKVLRVRPVINYTKIRKIIGSKIKKKLKSFPQVIRHRKVSVFDCGDFNNIDSEDSDQLLAYEIDYTNEIIYIELEIQIYLWCHHKWTGTYLCCKIIDPTTMSVDKISRNTLSIEERKLVKSFDGILQSIIKSMSNYAQNVIGKNISLRGSNETVIYGYQEIKKIDEDCENDYKYPDGYNEMLKSLDRDTILVETSVDRHYRSSVCMMFPIPFENFNIESTIESAINYEK